MVSNNWNAAEAQQYASGAGESTADVQLALQVYASRLIGADPDLVLHGGGNTSCKVLRRDIFGNELAVMHVKGSGHDLASIEPSGMPAIRLDAVRDLRKLDDLSDEQLVNTMRAALLDASGPNPSIETPLHAYLPHKFINHTHATAMIALADLPDAQTIVEEVFGDAVVTVPFHKPGFELGKAAFEAFETNPDAEGLILLNHGHFAFSDDPEEAYDRLIRHTNMVEEWFDRRRASLPPRRKAGNPKPLLEAREILPALRGVIGARRAEHEENRDAPMPIMNLRTGIEARKFLLRPDVAKLAKRGIATPDHVIRTKNYPLHLSAGTITGGEAAIAAAVDAYVDDYKRNFEENSARHPEPKVLLEPTPNVAWIEGLGVVGMGRDAKAAAIAADLAEQNIAAMVLAEDCGGFHPVGEQDLFDMEYWSLEQAKLGKSETPAMSGRVVMITGGAGAIGLATAGSFIREGANIFLIDLQEGPLAKALEALGPDHAGLALDITTAGAARTAVDACIARFGGLDILVSNAGAAWTGEMTALDDATLRKSFELNFFAHQTFAKAAARVFAEQNRGGQILFNVSKQAVNPGKGFGAYGLPKAATMFLLRQLALELGPKGVRVNGINADRIRSGLLDDAFIAERSRARGVDEDTYMAGNLLNREVEASHVADAFVALAGSQRTTAHVMTVDGGNIEAALR